MPILPLREILEDAARGQYAVGYFECWNHDSLLAVADAAEAVRSPVLLGFSGIYLPHPMRIVQDRLDVLAALGLAVCKNLSVPTNLVFNESPHLDWVLEAIDLGFGMVMFSDERLSVEEQIVKVREIVEVAHQRGVAVEGEALSLPGVAGELASSPYDLRLTDIGLACEFVDRTKVDAFAVNIGQAHLHGRQEMRLDIDLLVELNRRIKVPLVLHGSSSVRRSDLTRAIQLGIRKINVGSRLKQVYFEGIRDACQAINKVYNPYDIVGSGLKGDVLIAGRIALQKTVQDLMELFGSTDKV